MRSSRWSSSCAHPGSRRSGSGFRLGSTRGRDRARRRQHADPPPRLPGGARGAARHDRRGDQRRQRRDPRRVHPRGRAGRARSRAADPRDGCRRRLRSRRPALPRLGRGRAHGDRRERRAMPGGLHREGPRRVVLLRARGRPARARGARPDRDRARPRRAAPPGARRDRPAPRGGDRVAREPVRPGHGPDRRRLRRRRGRAAPRAGARGRPARGARTGGRPRASSPWPSSGRLQA